MNTFLTSNVCDRALLWNYCSVGIAPETIKKIEEHGLTYSSCANGDKRILIDLIGKPATTRITSISTSYDPSHFDPADVSLFYLCKYGFESRIIKYLIDKGLTYPILEFCSADFLHSRYDVAFPMAKKAIDAFLSSELRFTSEWEGSRVFDDLESIYSFPEVRSRIFETIISVFRAGDSISLFKLKSLLPPLIRYSPSLRHFLIELQRTGKIKMDAQGFQLVCLTADQYVETIEDAKGQQVFSEFIHKRDNDPTIRTKGKHQLYRTMIEEKPPLFEDRFIGLFTKYSIPIDVFCEVFQLPDTSYYYLRSICSPGKENVSALLEDSSFDFDYKQRLTVALKARTIEIDGRVIERNQESIIEYLIETECISPISFDFFKKRYESFVSAYCLKDTVSKSIDQPSFWHVINNNKACLIGENLTVHYVPLSDDDVKDIIDCLDLKFYKNVEIALNRRFIQHEKELVKKGILSSSELYSLLAKNNSLFDGQALKFEKYPFVSIGDADRSSQILDLLIELSPIATDEFAREYEKRYGVPANIVQSSFLTPYAKYYSDGLFDLRGKELSSSQIDLIKKKLTGSFYTLSAIKKTIKAVVPDYSTNDITDHTLSKIGFRRTNNYVFSSEYQTLDSYIKKLLSERDIFSLDSIDAQISSISRFQKILGESIEHRDIVEFDNRQYISIERLANTGITQEVLQSYCDKVAELAGANGYFTVYSINHKGAATELEQYGFEDIFYESLLKTDHRFKYKSVNNSLLFLFSDENVPDYFDYFIEQLLDSSGSKDAYDLISEIHDTYQITLSISRLRDLIKDSSMFYDRISDKIYIDYDRYLEDI